jgi:spore coat protein SA
MGRIRLFDVVHIHNRPQWVPLLRRLGYRGKLLLHLQNDHLGHWLGPALDRLATQLDGLAVCSKYLMQTFASKSPSIAAKTRVIYNGVDTSLFCPRKGLREGKTIFLVGRFDPQKGVLQLVRAYARVLENHPDAVLLIAGTTGFGTHHETEYVRKVRDLADSLMRTKHARIEFLGYVHHDRQLPELFQRSSVFACPSIFQEPFGLVNAEAMACGTAVVGANRGGIPEVLGDAGLLVDPEDTEELANALSTLLANPRYQKQLGDAALIRCLQMFDWGVIAKEWVSFLKEAGASKP